MKLSEIRKLQQSFPTGSKAFPPPSAQDLIHFLGFESGSFYQELEMESPYVDTHQDITASNSQLQFHSHTFYEMLCCRNTCGAEYLVASERYKLQRGDIILVPPGISHRPLLPDHMQEPYQRDVIWISDEFIQMLALTTPELIGEFKEPFLFRTAGTKWEYLCDMFRSGVKEAEYGKLGWNTIITANTLDILVHLARAGMEHHNKQLPAEKPELLDRVLSYVDEHMAEKISLADTAHHFYVSESTITQTFRKKMDVSFYRYVTQRRLIASKALIENGAQLENVAEDVGFTDYSSFYRAFKQEYGISPRQYRKMQNL